MWYNSSVAASVEDGVLSSIAIFDFSLLGTDGYSKKVLLQYLQWLFNINCNQEAIQIVTMISVERTKEYQKMR